MGVPALLAAALTACGGGGGNSSTPPTNPVTTKYTIGGSVSGLTGSGLVLQNNGGDNLAVAANGTFTFATSLSAGSTYAVTVATQPSGQTCTVTGGSGTANANVTNVAVACAAAAATTVAIGGQVTGLTGTGLVLQDNGGDNLAISQNGAFTFATKIGVNTAYAVTVSAQPSGQTCTVAGGSGTAAADVTSVSVSCAAATGSTFTIGGTVTGLTGGGLVLQDNGGDNLTVAANGTFTFATPVGAGGNFAYAVTVSTQPTGPSQLCRVSSGTGTASANVSSVAVNCLTTGKFLYTANHDDGTITGYSIDPATGALTSNSGGTDIADGVKPAAVSLAPNGKWAFSASDKGQKIHAFTINQTTGALTEMPGSPFDNSTAFVNGHDYPDIAVDPQSKTLYLASQGDNLVVAFSIDQTSGALSFIASYPAGTGAGGIPAFSPDGKYLYVMNQDTATPTPDPTHDNSVSGYAINADGSLSPLNAGLPFPTGGVNPTWISFRPDGAFAYVSNSNNGSQGTVTVFSVTNGVLAPVGTPVAVGNGPADLTIDATGTHLYVPNRHSADISVFAIDQNAGTLTAVGAGGQPAGAGLGPMLLVIEPTGRFAYCASSFGNDVWQYDIAADGSLTPIGSAIATGPAPTAPATLSPLFVDIDPSGQFAYVSNSSTGTAGNGGGIAAFSIDQNTGALAPITGSPYRSGLGAFQVSISPEAPGVRD